MEARVIEMFAPREQKTVPVPVAPPVQEKESALLFLDVLNEYVSRYIQENNISYKTKSDYKYLTGSIKAFCQAHQLESASLSDISPGIMETMKSWLHTEHHKCSLVYASRHVRLCERVFNFAVGIEYLAVNPLKKVSAPKPKEIPERDTVTGERLFLYVLKEYADRHIVENSLRRKTQNRYRYFSAAIVAFFEAHQLQALTLTEMRLKIMEQMKYWLQTNYNKCSLGHASRHAEMCKRAMDYAVIMEYIPANPLAPLRAKRDKTKEVVYLEKEELERYMSVPVAPKIRGRYTQKKVSQDTYAFQCLTGLSYGDLYTYKVIEREGRLWIMNQRVKNDHPYFVPIFLWPKAVAIHKKYDGKFPHVGDCKYNQHIRNIAAKAGIKKHLTTHTGRKTFACHRDAEGWSLKSIADMMGNTPDIVLKHYLAQSTKRIENELLTLGINSEQIIQKII